MKRERYKMHRDRCSHCGGSRSGMADLAKKVARFEVTFPSRCHQKNKCEREIISALNIEPVRTPTGEIAR